MLYNVTKVYVLNSQVLYVDEGEISRDSSNFNQIDVITNVTGFSAEIAFKLPNGVFSNRIGLIQQTGTVTVPSNITELQSVAGQSWSTYTMFIDNAVLSAITSTTSQTLEFSVRFTNQITNLLVFDELTDFPTVGEGDKVYQADNTGQYYVWNGVNYVTKTQQEANALIVNEGQVYTTEPSFLSIQGTIGGDPLALDPAFYQNQIVSSFNNLVALYNSINNFITDPQTGLNNKVNRNGDTMTGALAFSNADATRLVMGNNDITTDGSINATTFANGNFSSDAVKFSNFANLFAITIATPTGGQTWIDTTAAALAAKFAGVLTVDQFADFFIRKDGSNAFTGNLNMGGNQITNVGNVDGVDVSAFKQAYDTHTHTISQVDNLQSALDTLTGNVSALGGAFVFRGVIANTTAQVEADTSLLTTRIDVLLERTPQTGDVLKDSEGGEWYYDGAAWRFMGQASIDLTQYYTKSEADGEFAALTHTHVETDITDLDKYTQAQVDTLLDGKAAAVHTHVETDITDLDKYTQSEVDGFLDNKINVDGLNSEIDELTFVNKLSTEEDVRESKLFVEGCCIKYEHDDGLIIRLGKELVFRNFKNATGSLIPKGTPVMFAGQQGQSDVTLIKPATVDTQQAFNLINTPTAFFGLAAQDIANDEFGAITHFGDVEGINVPFTTGSVVFFDPAGGLTTTEPNGINPKIIVGIVRRQNVGQSTDTGIIFVNPVINPRPKDLMGVLETNVANKQSLVYDSQLGYYVNKTIVLDADLFANGQIKAELIPFQFEDVLQGFFDEANNKFFESEDPFEDEITGEEGKLYIDLSTNRLFRFNGVSFVLIIDAAEINSLNDIPDVVITGVQNDEALVYNSATGKWENKAIPRTVTALTDTTIDNAQAGQVLTWNGTAWVNAAIPDKALNDLTDVVITTPASNNLIVYNGTNFVNQAGSSSLVGLNNVQNFGLATQGEAEAGTSDEKYMTPLKTAQAIAELTPAETGLANVVYLTTTIATTDWSGTDPVTAVKTVSGVLSTDKPLIDIDLSAVAFANVEDKQTEYAKIYRVAATDANEITFYALEAPTEELVIQIKVVR